MTLTEKKKALQMYKKEVRENQILRDLLSEINHVLDNDYFNKHKNYDDVIPFVLHRINRVTFKIVKNTLINRGK